MASAGSLVVRRQLGAKLRQLRMAAGKSLADVDAASLGSKAKLSRIESGKGPVKIADVRALCWLYGASDETTDALTALAPGTQQDDWWEAYGAAVVPDPPFVALLELRRRHRLRKGQGQRVAVVRARLAALLHVRLAFEYQ
jgi:transcriptional regulator with XRE-family HTH domain